MKGFTWFIFVVFLSHNMKIGTGFSLDDWNPGIPGMGYFWPGNPMSYVPKIVDHFAGQSMSEAYRWAEVVIGDPLGGYITKSFHNHFMDMMEYMMGDSDRRINRLRAWIRTRNMRKCEFEVGYLISMLHEKYRKMIDLYKSTSDNYRAWYMLEVVVSLEEISALYFESAYMIGMLHEVERKHGCVESQYEKYNESLSTLDKYTTTTPVRVHPLYVTPKTPKPKKRRGRKITPAGTDWYRFFSWRYSTARTDQQTTKWGGWRDYIYGWEIDYGWQDHEPWYYNNVYRNEATERSYWWWPFG